MSELTPRTSLSERAGVTGARVPRRSNPAGCVISDNSEFEVGISSYYEPGTLRPSHLEGLDLSGRTQVCYSIRALRGSQPRSSKTPFHGYS